jgi:hypothetical protein
VYVLVISPAQGTKGLAQVSGLGNVVAPCNTKYNVDGVQFRRIQLGMTDAELADESKVRNIAAYKCFGLAAYAAQVTDPYAVSFTVPLNALDALRPRYLTDCDVPIAVIYWTVSGGIRFVDLWSVRRRLTRLRASSSLPFAVNDGIYAETAAMILQFKEHLDWLGGRRSLANLVATDVFRYLPPAGLLPLQTGTNDGIQLPQFFAGRPIRTPPRFIEGAEMNATLAQAIGFRPVDLNDPVTLRLYQTRENEHAVQAASAPRRFVLFASANQYPTGNPRFDLYRFDYANYAAGVWAP